MLATVSPTASTSLRKPIARPEKMTPQEGPSIALGSTLSSDEGEQESDPQQPSPAAKGELDLVRHDAKEPTDTEHAVIVERGKSLGGLAANIYGKVDKSVLEHLKRHNPQIENINVIQVGQRIFFPPIPVSE